MKTTIFLNEKFIPQEEAKLPVLTPGFLYGWGLFETMRAYNNRIVYFDGHLRRIKNSCVLFKMRFPYSMDKLKEIIQRTIKINGFSDAYVRLTLWKSDRGIDTLIVARKYQPYPSKKYRTGFKACISRFKQTIFYISLLILRQKIRDLMRQSFSITVVILLKAVIRIYS